MISMKASLFLISILSIEARLLFSLFHFLAYPTVERNKRSSVTKTILLSLLPICIFHRQNLLQFPQYKDAYSGHYGQVKYRLGVLFRSFDTSFSLTLRQICSAYRFRYRYGRLWANEILTICLTTNKLICFYISTKIIVF